MSDKAEYMWMAFRHAEPWEIMGLFTKKSKAIKACTKKSDGYTKIEVNKFMGEHTSYFDAYYPIPDDGE